MRSAMRTAVCLALASLAVSAFAADAKPSATFKVPAMLRADKRLEERISTALKDRPVGEALEDLEAQLEVKLGASRATADEKVTLFVKDRPAAQVLALIANHLGFNWRRSGAGYELDRDLASIRAEEALRQGELNSQAKAIQEHMRRLGQLANTPREALERRQQEVRDQLRAGELKPEDRARLMAEQALIFDLLRPGGATAVRLYGQLNLAQLRQLFSGTPVQLSSRNGTLAPAAAEMIHQAAREMRTSGRVTALSIETGGIRSPALAAPPGGGAPDDDAPPNAAEVNFQFQMGGDNPFRLTAGAMRRVSFMVRMSSIREQNERGGRSDRVLPVIWTPTVMAPAGGVASRAVLEDPDLQGALTLKVDGQTAAPEAPVLRAIGFRAADPNALSLGDALAKLQETTGLEIVCDSYIRARIEPRYLAQLKTPAQLLEHVIGTLDYDVVKDGKVLLLRSRRWYFDRPAEVPAGVLKPWASRVRKVGAPRLDDLAQLAAALSDLQAQGMTEYWSIYLKGTPSIPPPQGPGGFYGSRHHLRFWAGLTVAQRSALMVGGTLPVARMNRIQANAFATAMLRTSDRPWTEQSTEAPPPPAAISAGAFSLAQQQMRQQAYGSTDGEGRQARIMTIAPLNAPGGEPPRLPDGSNFQPVGASQTLNNFTFRYYLGGSEEPYRRADIHVPHPTPAAGPK
jgi:hypothetical protein